MGGRYGVGAGREREGFRVEGTAYRMPSADTFRILSFGNSPQIYLPELPNVPNTVLELEIGAALISS